MRLRHIEVFHAVYTCGSITGAARLLKVSQPSVSKVLAHAEQQLGFPLFDRQKGKIVPTREAERLIDHVTDVYKNINELRRTSQNLGSAETGVIRIAMTPAFGIDLVPAAVASYLDQHPDTSFEIETLHHHQVARALKELRVDVGLVFDPPVTQGITNDHIATAEFVVLTHESMRFGNRRRLSLKDLEGLNFIKLNTRSPLGRHLASHFASSKVRFHSVAKVETHSLAKSLVAHGAGVAIVDEFTARSLEHDNVVSWQLEPELRFNVTIQRMEHESLSIVTRRFIEHLKSEVKKFLQPSART